MMFDCSCVTVSEEHELRESVIESRKRPVVKQDSSEVTSLMLELRCVYWSKCVCVCVNSEYVSMCYSTIFT